MTNLDSTLKSKDITKVRLVKAMVFPVVMHGCESWTVKKAECQRIDAFELWYWRRLLRVPWTARRYDQFIPKKGNVKESSNYCTVQSLSCVRLCDPKNRSTPGLPVHHHLPEFTQTRVHQVCDVIQPFHPRSSPSPPAPNPSQHQSFPMSQLFT